MFNFQFLMEISRKDSKVKSQQHVSVRAENVTTAIKLAKNRAESGYNVIKAKPIDYTKRKS